MGCSGREHLRAHAGLATLCCSLAARPDVACGSICRQVGGALQILDHYDGVDHAGRGGRRHGHVAECEIWPRDGGGRDGHLPLWRVDRLR